MAERKYLILQEQINTTDNMPISKGAVNTALEGKVDKNGTDRLMTAAEGTKLAGIAEGAQVNVLEGIKLNGTPAVPTDKVVDVTPAGIGAAAASHAHGNADLLTGIDASKITVGTLPMSVIPAGALPTLVVVADTAARLALTIDDVQNGDVVKQEDNGLMYYVKDETKLGTEDAFEVFKSGEAASVEWANVKNKVEADASNTGILKAADWATFNGKQDKIEAGHELPATLVSETETRKFVTPAEKTEWSGKQDAITDSNKLGADLVDDTNATHKFVTASEKTAWNEHIADSTIHVTTADKSKWNDHIDNTNNPHEVTKAQVGLGNADNTSDADKPVSTATQAALDLKVDAAGVTTLGKDANGNIYVEW